jgi:hypothetical protein
LASRARAFVWLLLGSWEGQLAFTMVLFGSDFVLGVAVGRRARVVGGGGCCLWLLGACFFFLYFVRFVLWWILSGFFRLLSVCEHLMLSLTWCRIVMIILFDMFGSFALEPGCFWWRCVVASESLCVLVLCLVEGSR